MPELTQEFAVGIWQNESIQKIVAKAMARPDFQTFKFDEEMVAKSKLLEDWAYWLATQYTGSFSLMQQFAARARDGKRLSPGQLKVVLNTMLKAWKEQIKAAAETADPTFDKPITDLVPFNETQTVEVPHPGIYTVSFGAEHRTLKFAFHKQSGRTYISYLCGPDNLKDYATCGFVDKDGVLKMYSKGFKKDTSVDAGYDKSKMAACVRFMCGLGSSDLLKAGEAFSQMAGVCFICGRVLTVPSSISQMMGPVCAKSFGSAYGL